VREFSFRHRFHSKQLPLYFSSRGAVLTWMPASIHCAFHLWGGPKNFPLELLMAIFTPMQGFFRYLVYVRPKWIEYRKHHPEIGRCKAIARIFCEQFGNGSENEDSTERKRSGRFSTSAQETGGASFFSRKTSSRASISSMKKGPFVSDVRPSPVSEEEHKEEEHAHDEEDNMQHEHEIVSGNGNDEETPKGAVTDDCHKVRFDVMT
jgi:hypothetical protein